MLTEFSVFICSRTAGLLIALFSLGHCVLEKRERKCQEQHLGQKSVRMMKTEADD